MPPSAPKDPQAVQLGEWLMQRRIRAGYNRPEMVKRAQDIRPDAQISQDYLGKLEYGTRSLLAASDAVREGLRLGLGIKPDEWEAVTGLQVQELRIAPAAQGASKVETLLSALLDAAKAPAPSGRFVPSSRLSLYGQPEGMTYVPNEIDRPQVEAVLLDSHGMEAGGMLYGATLYIDPAERTPEAGRVYLIEHDGRYDVRRAAAHGTEVWYYADSPAQGGPPLQAGRVRVLGRVFKWLNPPHDA